MGLNTQIPDVPNGFGNSAPLFLAHAIHSPLDNNEYYFAWRVSQAPEIGPNFNNRAMMPNIKTVIRSVQITWRCANTPSLEVVPFYISVWDANNVFKQKTKVAESPIIIPAGYTAWWCFGNMEDIHCGPNDLIMMSYIQTWVTNPSNLMIGANVYHERVL